jgi:hypothetical protein
MAPQDEINLHLPALRASGVTVPWLFISFDDRAARRADAAKPSQEWVGSTALKGLHGIGCWFVSVVSATIEGWS